MAPTMKAARFHGMPTGVVVDDVPRPVPGPGEVVVAVAACGVCGSDVHFLEGMPVPGPVPIILGHEPAGLVEAVGEGVTGWSEGDRVAITLDNGCGECRTCRMGMREACMSLTAPGLHFDGAYAEAIKVPAECLISVPDGVSLAAAAVATDCVGTPYHALKCRARLQPGETVVVVGVGGLGQQAVILAKVLGAERVVAADTSPVALERAARNGADATVLVTPGQDPVSEIQAAAGGGAEVALECVGVPETSSVAIRSICPGGRAVLVGVGMSPPPVDWPQALFSLWEMSIIGTFASHKHDVEELLAMDAAGTIDIDASITHRIGIEQVPDGLDMLMHHRGDPQRIVMENPL